MRSKSAQLKDLHALKMKTSFNGQLFEGDGVISRESGLHGIIRMIHKYGLGAQHFPGKRPDDVREFTVDWWVKRSGRWIVMQQGDVLPLSVRRETFIEYLRRPSGFGRIPWPQAYLISGMLLLGFGVSAYTWNDGGGWVALGLLVIPAAVLFASYMQYTRRWV